MKEFLKFVASHLVNQPELIDVHEVVGNSVTLLEITCAKADIGKLIGKNGQTIEAIRLVMIAIASKMGIRISVEVNEPKE